MVTKQLIDDFIAQKTLAVIGVSGTGKKFSNTVYRELESKGYRLFPVNNNVDTVGGETCYSRVEDIPETVDAALIFVKPEKLAPSIASK